MRRFGIVLLTTLALLMLLPGAAWAWVDVKEATQGAVLAAAQDGLKVYFVPGARATVSVPQVVSAWSRLPEDIRDKLEGPVSVYLARDDGSLVVDSSVSASVRLQVLGVCSGADTVVLYPGAGVQTFLHELGHMLDHRYGRATSREFLLALVRDKPALSTEPGYVAAAVSYLSGFAPDAGGGDVQVFFSRVMKEEFADAFALYAADRAGIVEALPSTWEEVRAKYAARFEYFDSLFSVGSNS
ncbi:hypothetical protein [Syntrophothermus lipocalidus]|uniref:Uncharacterized protein n=1 Tax=Syntrophothermus lipocalidus (strain DSM 12680 / TGB-C1) TaxID=643648 RepID=D7CQ05_SYNLT|nr:hypothetical protein [Syntrophothermus lipocalidus]ADI02783.1 hypothetical protein Slip_2036 [Syntrophothermus lipocalidus DSM 12680]